MQGRYMLIAVTVYRELVVVAMLLRTAVQLGRLCCSSSARIASPGVALLPASSALRAVVNSSNDNPQIPSIQRPFPQPLHRFPLLGAWQHAQTSSFSTTGGSSPDDLTQQIGSFDAEAITTILQSNRAVEAASIVAAKADAYLPTEFFINLLDFVHAETLWPCAVQMLQGVNAAMARLKELQDKASRAEDYVEYQRLTARAAQEQQELMSKHGKTLKMTMLLPLGALLNGAIFISLFSAINRLTTEKVPSLVHGGSMWFTDLTVPDPFFGIPVFCCVVTLASVELGALTSEMGASGNAEMMQRMKWFMRFISFAFIPAGNYVPAGVGILWVSNSIFGIVQSSAFRLKVVRDALGLPKIGAGAGAGTGVPAVAAGGEQAALTGMSGLLGGGAKAKAAAALQPPPPKPKLLQKRPLRLKAKLR